MGGIGINGTQCSTQSSPRSFFLLGGPDGQTQAVLCWACRNCTKPYSQTTISAPKQRFLKDMQHEAGSGIGILPKVFKAPVIGARRDRPLQLRIWPGSQSLRAIVGQEPQSIDSFGLWSSEHTRSSKQAMVESITRIFINNESDYLGHPTGRQINLDTICRSITYRAKRTVID